MRILSWLSPSRFVSRLKIAYCAYCLFLEKMRLQRETEEKLENRFGHFDSFSGFWYVYYTEISKEDQVSREIILRCMLEFADTYDECLFVHMASLSKETILAAQDKMAYCEQKESEEGYVGHHVKEFI